MPLIGQVAAGQPILAQENIENYFPIPVEMLPNNKTFLLTVRGESMINAGILDGDYVLVEERHTADNGDMVVALIEDGATVKTFYKEEGVIRLQPENDFMDPIIVRDVQILGRVIGRVPLLQVKGHNGWIQLEKKIPGVCRGFSFQSEQAYYACCNLFTSCRIVSSVSSRAFAISGIEIPLASFFSTSCNKSCSLPCSIPCSIPSSST